MKNFQDEREILGQLITSLGSSVISSLSNTELHQYSNNYQLKEGLDDMWNSQVAGLMGLKMLEQVMKSTWTRLEELVDREKELQKQLVHHRQSDKQIPIEYRKVGSVELELQSQGMNCVVESGVEILDAAVQRLKENVSPSKPSVASKRKIRNKLLKVKRKISPSLDDNDTNLTDPCYVPETLPVDETEVRKGSGCRTIPDSPDKSQTRATVKSPTFKKSVVDPRLVDGVKIKNAVANKLCVGNNCVVTEDEIINNHKSSNSIAEKKSYKTNPTMEGSFNMNGVDNLSNNEPDKDIPVVNIMGNITNDVEKSKNKKYSLGTDSESHISMVESPKTAKVGKVTPSVQSEIDKKSYQELDVDFPIPKRRKFDSKRLIPPPSPSVMSDSDFESPNLLERKRPLLRQIIAQSNDAHVTNYKECRDKSDDDIETVKSPDEIVEFKTNKNKEINLKTLKGLNKVENRWGMEIEDVTTSQKKRLKSQKQSKLDVFFKNPKPSKASSEPDKFKRINHADMDVEKALKLSRETMQKELKGKVRTPDKATENNVDENIDYTPDKLEDDEPVFAYVNSPVRGKEARKKLYGFDCRECQEFYHMKLEEGLSKDQILMLMNQCSRHRGKFKPPLTPDKYWDPDIVEQPNDPRHETQYGVPLLSRNRRKAEARAQKAALAKVAKNLGAPAVE